MSKNKIIDIPYEEVNNFDINFGHIEIQGFLLCRWWNRTKIEGSEKQLIIANSLFWILMMVFLLLDIVILAVTGFFVLLWLIGKFFYIELFQKFLNPILAKILFVIFLIVILIITGLLLAYRFPTIKELILTVFDYLTKL